MHIKKEVATYTELTHWYNNQYRTNGTWHTNRLYAQALIDLLVQAGLTRSQHKTLLDVACGGAFFIEYSQLRFAHAFGCDISRVGLAEARQRCAALSLCEANSELLPFRDDSVDVLTCLGSLEHFLQPEQALTEIHRVVRSDGIIMILVPINPDWAIYDIQPTEIVLEPGEWERRFRSAGLETLLTIATDDYPELKSSSAGCQVYCLKPIKD